MTGRPGHHTKETNGRSAVSYLVRALAYAYLNRSGSKGGVLAFQGRRGIASVWNLRQVVFGVDSLWRALLYFGVWS